MSGLKLRRARRIRGLLVGTLLLALALPACAPAQEFEPNESAEQAAQDYAAGVLAGDIGLASQATGVALDAADLDAARVELFGFAEQVPGAVIVLAPDPEIVASRDDEEPEATVFVVESYETPEGVSVPIAPPDGAPEVWVTAEEPWRAMRMQDQTTALWFVAVVLLIGLAITATVVVLLIRIANKVGVPDAGA